jgi:hypothetical protein
MGTTPLHHGKLVVVAIFYCLIINLLPQLLKRRAKAPTPSIIGIDDSSVIDSALDAPAAEVPIVTDSLVRASVFATTNVRYRSKPHHRLMLMINVARHRSLRVHRDLNDARKRLHPVLLIRRKFRRRSLDNQNKNLR